jgi:hypothetical protein
MDGILIGLIAFLVIGLFHPVVIYGEYHFGTKLWPVFLFFGILLGLVSLFVENIVLNAALGIIAFSFFWSVLELFKQKKRVDRGWFPKKQKAKNAQTGDNNKTCHVSKDHRETLGYHSSGNTFSSNISAVFSKNGMAE